MTPASRKHAPTPPPGAPGTIHAGPFEVGGYAGDGGGLVVVGTDAQTWTLTVAQALALAAALERAADVAEGHCEPTP